MGATYQSPLVCPLQRRRETSLFPRFLESQASARHAGGVQTPYALGLVVVSDSVATGCSSLHGKATGLLHRGQQLLIELLIGLIGRDVDPIKARRGGQRSQGHCGELPSPRHTEAERSGWGVAAPLPLGRCTALQLSTQALVCCVHFLQLTHSENVQMCTTST